MTTVHIDFKSCKICNESKELNTTNFRFHNTQKYWFGICRECEREKNRIRNRNYWLNDNENKKNIEKRYRDQIHRKEIRKKQGKIRRSKPEERAKINKYRKKYISESPERRIRASISGAIYEGFKKTNKRKNSSILKNLPYTMKELKEHLESLFEPWMNWDNWGKYYFEKWNDNDFSTWTWQIDHIIPQSKLLYNSYNHPNFLKCWALSNLRPLSAKENLIKGNR